MSLPDRAPLRANRRPVHVAGARGRYWDLGNQAGRVVVLLASQLARGQAYLRTAHAIALLGRRVILVEMPGCGGGSRLPQPWSFDEYARWIAAFLERLRLLDVTLVGHSNSGAAAALAAAAHPARIARLVLVDSTGARRIGALPWVLIRHIPEFIFELYFTVRAGPDVLYNMLVHPANFWRQVRSALDEVVIGRVRGIRAATLIAWGELDFTVPIDCAAILQRAIDGARIHIEPQATHDWIIERPSRFARMLAQFIDRSG